MEGTLPSGRSAVWPLARAFAVFVALAVAFLLLARDGAPAQASGPTAITVGTYHSCAVMNGGAWCWGYGEVGQLGDGQGANSNVPVQVFPPGSGVTDISAGYEFTCAVKDGEAWCWGANGEGQLGTGDKNGSDVPVRVCAPGETIPCKQFLSGVTAIAAGYEHTCALTGGEVWCWGWGIGGQLGSGDTESSLTPVQVCAPEETAPCAEFLTGVSEISAGWDHVCALIEGSARCWGRGEKGQLGNGLDENSSVPVQVSGFDEGVTAISPLWDHTCAIKDGDAWCWGSGDSGKLGTGDTEDNNEPVQVCAPEETAPCSEFLTGVIAIVAGDSHSCAASDGVAWCWGDGLGGRLGTGDTDESHVPVPVCASEEEELPCTIEDGNVLTGVIAMAADQYHSCALTDEHVLCWGRGDDGQLGNGADDESLVPVQVLGLEVIPEEDRLWGDVDCDSGVAIGDALKIARYLLGLSVSQEEGCPDIGSDVIVDAKTRTWGDADCDAGIAIGDALKTARHLLGLSVSQEEGCPEIGSTVAVSEAPGPLEIDVTMVDNAFDPNEFAMPPGATIIVHLENNGSLTHNMRVAGADNEFNTEDDAVSEPAAISGGASGTLTWTAPEVAGEYDFRCDFHPGEMTGTITVGPLP
jgi:alpha-tubulin suppressor-like RCC1 family protein/plastocyanin